MADWEEVMEGERSRLFGLAYRLLGSAADAEDVVQEAFLRLSVAEAGSVRVPRAWLVTVATNLSLTRLSSAARRHERYVGVWLPEPVLTSEGALGPLETAEQRDAVSLALLTLLERLTPAERAVFVLRESFGYSYREIAAVVGKSEGACRRLQRRAHRHVAEPVRRERADPALWRRLVEAFFTASWNGDVAGLEELLTEDVTYWGDGGGMLPVARRPVRGRTAVARFFTRVIRRYLRDPGATEGLSILVGEVNGERAVIVRLGSVLLAVSQFDINGGQIGGVRILANPVKLAFFDGQAAARSHPELLFGQVGEELRSIR